MNDMTIANVMNPAASMNSREIAGLTGKEHKNVLRDIDRMVEGLGSDLSFGIKSSTYAHPNGGTRRQYVLDKDSTICLVAGYDVTARMRIIKRWQELEAQAAQGAFKIPQTYEEALRLAADKVAEVKALEHQVAEQEDVIEHLEPKAKFHDEVHDASGLMTMGEAANRLQIGRTTLFHILREKGVLKKDGGKYNTPYQVYIDRGLFRVKAHTYDTYGNRHVTHTTYVTPKGMTYLFKLLHDW